MRNLLVFSLVLLSAFLTVGCSNAQPQLKGSYQSEKDINGYIIQLSVQPDEAAFIEYIDNREVDKGTYKEMEAGKYLMSGDKQELTVDLGKDNSFYITVKKLNDGKPIKMINLDKVPTTFSTEFNDVEEYENLLEE